MTNFVEAGKAAESLTDDGLKQAANFGHPMVPPIVALTEITRRKEMRERYQKARNKMPDATIKDQILGASPLDGGVMSNVPQAQMAARPPMPRAPVGGAGPSWTRRCRRSFGVSSRRSRSRRPWRRRG